MPGDQDFNSMQAQLGLVGGSGSFNPLGIATPAPPPPPMVRHPGEISSDIVRQTQTQMATTLQTTSAMRMGGMGGMAFGGGSGMGMGAIGAFSQQYQQNMAGINAQQISPFSAQMMGMMGGMGGGFNPGMLPNPAMMTTPGMGIYRPFPQQQGATVSPFPQMPMFQTPLTPMPPPPMFQTPMELSNNMAIQAGQRQTAAMFAVPGVMARAGADIGMGYMGAGVGASLGARFGPMGALIGGGLGMAAGAFGSEHFGMGATAQHMVDRLNPFRTMAIRGQQMLGASQEFVTGGSDLNMSGRGLSHHGATHLGRMLEDTAFSSGFRRQTGGAFSAQDLTRITQVSGQQGMLNDAQSVDAIHDRVKGIAKSLVGFMKIANEPNVVEALKSMGRMRAMGLSMAETMDAAVDARMFSRMAGTSTKGLMESGGLPGAMLFQQQGLSAGLGMRMGMGAMGMAGAAVAGGAYSPQRLAMLGGVQGVAQHEMESSAAFLKMPMMVAAATRMGSGGEFGVDGRALSAIRGGGMNIGGMAATGANNLLDAVRKQGVGALGMMQVQGTELQDSIGRLLGPQGVQAAKIQQVMQTMGMMGLDKNPGGFATAALSMGMTNDQVKSMMSQAGSPGYWQNMQKQNRIQQMEVRGLEAEERDRNMPGLFAHLTRGGTGNFTRSMNNAYSGLRNVGEGAVNFFSEWSENSQARDRGQVVLRTDRELLSGSNEETRAIRGMSEADANMGRRLRDASRGAPSTSSELRRGLATMTGGDTDVRALRARRMGGFSGYMSGGILEGVANLNQSLIEKGMEYLTGGEFKASNLELAGELNDADYARGSDMAREGMKYEDNAAYSEQMTAVAKKTGLSAQKVGEIAAEMRLNLGQKKKEDASWWDKGGKGMRGSEIDKEIDKAILAKGEDPSKFSAEEKQALFGGLGTAHTGLTAEDNVDVKGHKEFIEKSRGDLEQISAEMFGDAGIMNRVTGGASTERQKILSAAFGKGRTGRGLELLALKKASRGENSTKEAGDAYTQAEAEAAQTEEGQQALREMRELEKDLGSDHDADLATLGRSEGTLSSRDRKLAISSERMKYLSVKRDAVQRAGKRLTFGEGVSASASIGELLGGDTKKMSAGMSRISKRYKEAELSGDKEEMARLEKEASAEALRQGVSMDAETAGGVEVASDKGFESRRETMAEAEKSVDGVFPRSVEKFDAASRAMLRAAELLSRGSNRPTLDNDTNPYGR